MTLSATVNFTKSPPLSWYERPLSLFGRSCVDTSQRASTVRGCLPGPNRGPSGVLTTDMASLMILPIRLHTIRGDLGLAVRGGNVERIRTQIPAALGLHPRYLLRSSGGGSK